MAKPNEVLSAVHSVKQRMRAGARVCAALLALAVVGSPLAVHAQTSGAVGSAATVKARNFGDTATFALHILSLDREKEIATYSANKDAKHLIVLAVVPGREIEVISPGTGTISSTKMKGVRAIMMRRMTESVPDAGEDARARLAYDRCMSQAAAQAQRAAAARRVKRDSSGRIISDPNPDPVADEQQFRRQCDRLAASNPKKRSLTPLPPREAAERYLLVLASSSEVQSTQLYERLASLTAIAPDAATTLEAIAAGLFVGVPGSWSGSFVNW